MNTMAPSKSKIAVMVAFAASCVGLLLFLWLSFGGSVPFVPQGYRITVEFNEAVQLGTQADVDIAGVTVGNVVSVGLDRQTGLTRAVLQIDPKYAPRPANTRAILRQKTLLGETYVELSFGNPHGPMLHDGARLPQAQVAPTVQLDQILDTFDPKTRAGVRDLDAGRRHRLHQPRPGLQRRARRALPVRGQRLERAGGARARQQRDQHAARRRRPGAVGDQPQPGAAAGADPQRQHRVRGHGRAQPGAGRGGQGVPGVPAEHA